ncbi:MAG: hypothetical protein HZR80_20980 [Candidatus Heimdallarchaeota archaeon]
MVRDGQKCRVCDSCIHTDSKRKHGSRTFAVEESTFWTYSDGKTIPSVKFHQICSPECLAEWAKTSETSAPPDDLNCWVNGRKQLLVEG